MQSDLNIYCLPEELLLDFEPGWTETVARRLEKYVIADDVQVTDVGPHYGLFSVQGPKSAEVVQASGLGLEPVERPMGFTGVRDPTFGEIYCMNQQRGGTRGFDLFVPAAAPGAMADKLVAVATKLG